MRHLGKISCVPALASETDDFNDPAGDGFISFAELLHIVVNFLGLVATQWVEKVEFEPPY